MSIENLSVTVSSAREKLFVESALAKLRELDGVADAAAHGRVLADCEELAVRQSRQLGVELLESAMNRRIEEVEKKGRRADSVDAVALATSERTIAAMS